MKSVEPAIKKYVLIHALLDATRLQVMSYCSVMKVAWNAVHAEWFVPPAQSLGITPSVVEVFSIGSGEETWD